jgi:tRNA threonylcarbamoyladenosine biosynthesis protein TsaE
VEETEALGATLASHLHSGSIVLLAGDLGAGKTQFVKGLARALGVAEHITSPTFNLMVEHATPTGTLRHFDLYRLERAADLDDIDYFGLLEDDAVSVVEWGDKFACALPRDYLLVDCALVPGLPDERLIELSAHGPKSEKLLAAWAHAASRQAPEEQRPARRQAPEERGRLGEHPPPEEQSHDA